MAIILDLQKRHDLFTKLWERFFPSEVMREGEREGDHDGCGTHFHDDFVLLAAQELASHTPSLPHSLPLGRYHPRSRPKP